MARKVTNKKASGTSSPVKSKGMRITSRVVDIRRHTTGYVAGGKKYSVSQMQKMASKGQVKGVQVVGNHIQALPGQKRLTDLPTKIM